MLSQYVHAITRLMSQRSRAGMLSCRSIPKQAFLCRALLLYSSLSYVLL